MAKFNENVKGTSQTKNYEGAPAWKLPKELNLYSAVVTSTLSDKFYEGSQDRVKRIRKLISENDPMFVAQLAVYAREKMYLRSIPLVLAVELAKVHKGDDLVSRLVARVIQRADEITELLAYYKQANDREGVKVLSKLSKQISLGIAAAFNKFDEYQFAKYNRQTEIKLRDALFLTHPKAKSAEQQAIFDKIVKEELEVPYTWEVELSKVGQAHYDSEEEKEKAVRGKWAELVTSNRLGYMALLRNLRNILQTNPSGSTLEKVCADLTDKKNVLRSKQLPFRFLSAYKELESIGSPKSVAMLDALEDAVMHTAENIEGFGFDTSVCIACDVSGSMQKGISEKSKVQNFDIGLILGMILKSRCKSVITGMFGDTWKVIQMPSKQILHNSMEYHRREGEVGYSTNGWKVIDYLTKKSIQVDKVMIFTDCQLWDSDGRQSNAYISRYMYGRREFPEHTFNHYWSEYKKISPNSKLYLFDLAGYGNTPISVMRNDVNLIAGWSDKVFDVLSALENGGSALSEITKIEL